MPRNPPPRSEGSFDGGLMRTLWGSVKRRPSTSYPPYSKASDLLSSISVPIATDDGCAETLRKHYCPSSIIDLPALVAQNPATPTRSFSLRSKRTIINLTSAAPAAKRERKASTGSLHTLRTFSSTHLNSLGARLSLSSASSTDLSSFPTPPPRAPRRSDTPSPALPPTRTRAPTPTSPLSIPKRGSSSLYALKSFSTTHLNSLGSKLGAGANASLTDLSTGPSPSSRALPLRRTRSSARALPTEWSSQTWLSSIPDSAPQLAALDLFGSFSFPLLSELNAKPIGIPGVIMEEAEEEEVLMLPLAAALTLDARPSYIPLPPSPSTFHTPQWTHRASIAPSWSSGSDTDETAPSSASFSTSDSLFPATPSVDSEDTPLSPWRISPTERRKGSVVFPSRMNASCISLGTY